MLICLLHIYTHTFKEYKDNRYMATEISLLFVGGAKDATYLY
jgi:hypothetical protein